MRRRAQRSKPWRPRESQARSRRTAERHCCQPRSQCPPRHKTARRSGRWRVPVARPRDEAVRTPLLASCAGDAAGGGATQLLHARLRGGDAGSGRGAGSFVAEALTRLHDALPRDRAGRQGTVTLRADSGFYSAR